VDPVSGSNEIPPDGAAAVTLDGTAPDSSREPRRMSIDRDGAGMAPATKLLAFYLPQFHPVPENDRWWGRGFTEWTNVARARPLFRGHHQPHLPSDLGFYDLRLPATRQAQAELAGRHGIDGFCYYHYWFGGRRILQRPFEEVLSSGSPDFPFCLCWANEPWTRRWDGRSGEILIEQSYGPADDRAHIEYLLRAFDDRRYVRIGGKPLFLVYRASSLPEARRTTEIWRETARRSGAGELYLCRVESFAAESRCPPAAQGFDAAVEFQPDWACLDDERWSFRLRSLAVPGRFSRLVHRSHVFDYARVASRMMAKPAPEYVRHPCVMPGWDNSPRRAREAYVFVDSHPDAYREWLSAALAKAARNAPDSLAFVNAWNEWGEGNHLEPCRRFGHAFLEATAEAVHAAQAQL
jgi:lipopolysaccharide biosynthesis protein